MKRTITRVGTIVLALVFVLAAVVLARLSLATVEVARAPAPESASTLADLGSTTSLTILPLYEEAGAPAFESGHGVSYLVRTDETTLLMDLGNNPQQAATAPMVSNMEKLGVSSDEANLLFVSHNHPDHLGGLQSQPSNFLTEEHSVLDVDAAYVPVELAFPGIPMHLAEAPQVIAPGVATLGRMPFVQPFPFWLWEPLGYEQVLAINVDGKGLVLITGCGHPTLEKIVARAEALFDEPVVGIVGGLHYESAGANEIQQHIDFLDARNPQLVALSPHDNGPDAIRAFQQAFPAAYRYIRVGDTIEFGIPTVAGFE